MIGQLSPERLDAEFVAFRVGDATDDRELLTRYAVVVGCGLALWFATHSLIMPVWAFGYVAINSAYVAFLRRKTAPTRPYHVRISLACSIVVTVWYCAMVVHVATLFGGDFLMLSVCGTVGLALHCLSRNEGFTISAYVDLIAVIVTSVCVFAVAIYFADYLGLKIAIAAGGLSAVGYFWLSFLQVISDRVRLSQRLQTEAQAQKMQALGQLASGIAHDFNNLLTVVGGNIDLYRLERARGRGEPQLLDEARRSVDRGAELVRQLLAYTKNSRMLRTQIDLNGLLADLEAVLRRTLPANIVLHIRTADSDCVLEGDRGLIESAILNLVLNSRDAIGPQTGRITIELEDAQSGEVLLRVADDGPGMSDEVRARATEPFFTTKPFGKGSGLGLSMVKGVAEQMGGTLTLESAPGAGLVVTMRLPRLTGAPQTAALRISSM